jgi:glycosyltransferase involved in cell wall biosynthesis
MEKCLLSIIVPVYNTSQYLVRCLNSLINQSVSDSEIIIINDGSTDQSDEIIKQYLAYCNITYIKLEKNMGLGYARNLGIERSSGKYIAFLDSDDWIDLDFFKVLTDTITRDCTDIVVGGVKNEWNNINSTSLRYDYTYHNIITANQALDLLTKSTNNNYFISPVVWNKIYKRELLSFNQLKFIDNSYWEDDIFSFKAISYAHKISLVPQIYYHYYQRDSSIMNSISRKHIDDLLMSFKQLKSSVIDNNSNATITHYQAMFDRCVCTLIKMIDNNEKDANLKKKYIIYFIEEFTKQFSLKEAINYLDNNRIMRLFN